MLFVVNAGSSSLKFRLYTDALEEVASGIAERIGLPKPFITVSDASGKATKTMPSIPTHAEALHHVFTALERLGHSAKDVTVFGHRVVHGGEEFAVPTRVTRAVLTKLKKYSKLAPLHNPPNIAGIEACMKIAPKAAQVAVFDTGFYRTLPEAAYMYALPWELYAKHRIRKYGFHGISHEYVTREAARQLGKPYASLNIVSCHLGSGSSVTAVQKGKAVDTTMGFTPLEGLTMTTRCGDIDPAIPLYLQRELKMTVQQVDDLMNRKSGLLGVCGYKDVRDALVAAGHKVPGYALPKKPSASQSMRAALAIDMFCYDVARYIGQFAATMHGADAVVFTAGVGERSDIIREKVMDMVSLPGNPKVLVVPTNEELMIARGAKQAAAR